MKRQQRAAREVQGRRLVQGAAARQLAEGEVQEDVGAGAHAAAGHAERSVAEAEKGADRLHGAPPFVYVGVRVSVRVLAIVSVL